MVSSILIWLVCIGISAILIAYALKENTYNFLLKREGFTTNIVMNSCPSGSSSYITRDGDTNCCEGDVLNKMCSGTNICSLSPKPPNGIKNCSDWMNAEWTKRASRFCPASMPNYFGPIHRTRGAVEGCAVSQTITNGSAPEDMTRPKCKIYSTEAEEYSQIDSCLNRKALDGMTAPGEKSIIRTPNDQAALLISTGIPNDGSSAVPVTCYDYNRYLRFLRTANPTVADSLTKDPCILGKTINMCGIVCKNKNEADLPKTVTPKQGAILGKITTTHNFSLSFDFTPYGLSDNWSNLLHFTTGNNCCDLGTRAPGIWFAPNTVQVFAIHVGHKNDGDWAARPQSDSVQINSKISFKLVCSGQNITVTIGNSNFSYSHDSDRYAGPVSVYSGDPWHPSANILIENLSYITL